MTLPATLESLVGLTEKVLGSAPHVTRESSLVNDLGMQSIELLGFIALCERSFDVSLSKSVERLSHVTTVGEFIELLEELQRERQCSPETGNALTVSTILADSSRPGAGGTE